MTLTINDTLATSMLGAAETAFAAGGTVEYRTGPPPATPADPDSGTLLVTFVLDVPAFSPPVAGSLVVAGGLKLAIATGTGVLGHARFKPSTGAALFDMPAGGVIPVLDTDDALDELTTTVAHGFVENQAIDLYEGVALSGPFYVSVVDATTIQLLASPGGSVQPMPPAGTFIAAYLRDSRFRLSLSSVSGTITTGDAVVLPDFGINL